MVWKGTCGGAPVKKSEKPLTSDSRVLTSTTASLTAGSAPARRHLVQLIGFKCSAQ